MYRLPPLTHHRPATLEEAVGLLAEHPDARVVGGGTDLVAALKYGLASPSALISVGGLPLAGIEHTAAGWTIGAGTTLWDLERWQAPAGLEALPRAAAAVAAPPIRSTATVGGNLCLDTRCVFYNQSAFWRSGREPCFKAGGAVCHVARGGSRCHACHQADLVPALIALGATVQLAGVAGSRAVALEQLYSGDGAVPLTLGPGELVRSVTLPTPPAAAASAYEKLRPRKGLDFPAASAAVAVARGEDGTCTSARVVLGAVASAPLRVPAAEAALTGSRLEPDALAACAAACTAAARPMKNADLTPAYRKQVAGVLAKRAAHAAWRRAAEQENQ